MEDVKIIKVLGKKYFMNKDNKKLYKRRGNNCGKLIGRRRIAKDGTYYIQYYDT